MRLRGSYTVEASWIMVISLSILCAAILFGFRIFKYSISYARENVIDVEYVTMFRQLSNVEEVLNFADKLQENK